jgi:replicative DNA helicase
MVQSIEEARRRQNTPAGRTPPHDLAAEQSVLGAMLLSREAISSAMEQTRAEDFYKPAHGHVFEAISNLYGEGEPVDAVTVADELRRAGLLEAIGGQPVLIDLLAATPSTGNAGRYGRIVSDHALLRRLIGAANEIADMGYDIPDDVHGAIDRAESMVFEIGQRKVADTIAPLRDLLEATLDRLEALYERGDAITGVPTGYLDIDEQLAGLQNSNLVIVGARPAIGKALALDTPIPTPEGWKTMGTLAVGDRVYDDQGQRCEVLYTSPVHRDHDCYRMRLEDGTEMVADGGHRWWATNRPAGASSEEAGSVVTTEEMFAAGVVDEAGRPVWHLPVASPLDGPDLDLPVEPYLLGWILGRESAPADCVSQPSDEAHFQAEARLREAPASTAMAALDPARHMVRYSRASLKQRLALVQGLMDACGTVLPSGQVELGLTSKGLLGWVREVVLSLGHKCGPMLEHVGPAPEGQSVRSWRLRWVPDDQVFLLDRKAQALAPMLSAAPVRREWKVVAIEPVPSVPVRCISVSSPSHLFLAGRSLVPTHNTAFALGIASHAAMHGNRPTLFFSLEMSHLEITQRLLSSEAQVNASRMRNGKLHEADWPKISHAIGRLGEAPLYIDDNPNLTLMDMRAKARRLKSRDGLELIIVDYIQLMTGRNSAENRQVEVSEISRGLKILARELEVPVIALSQLSRSLEQRADKRPMLADLRESGCLTGDARVLRADTGAEVTMAELLVSGERNIPVWSLDRDLKMVRSTMTHVFPTGIKPVFEMRLASGQLITASANHPFLTLDGWKRLEELSVGDRIATPRFVPPPEQSSPMAEDEIVMLAHLLGDGCVASRQPVHYTSADVENLQAVERAAEHFGITPRRVQQKNWWHVYLPAPYRLTHGRRNPIQAWLEPMGLDGLRSYEKFIPACVFALPNEQIALFVKHLWSTDGSIRIDHKVGQVRLYYASTSRRMIDGLQSLLLRLGIVSRIKVTQKGRYRPGYMLFIYGRESQERFLADVGVHGRRGQVVPEAVAVLSGRRANPNADSIPREVWSRIRAAMSDLEVSSTTVASALGRQYLSTSHFDHGVSRERLSAIATVIPNRDLRSLASSDVYWDRITSIEGRGDEPVFDATVLETHNFVANGIVLENSLEQDADVVMFLYRDEVYNTDSPDRGTAEVIVAKHRNGPTGTARLAFLDHYAKFANMAREP